MPLGQRLQQDISIKLIPLYLQIRNGHSNVSSFAYYLEYLTFHMPEKMLEPALKWLVRNQLTGQKFLDFVQGECARSGLELIRNLTMRLEREKKVRALTARDIR